MMNVKLSSSVAAAAALAVLAACAGGTDGSSRFAAPTGPSLDVVSAQTGTVCKSGPVGTYNFDLVFGGSANTGDVQSTTPLAITVTDASTPACTTVFTRTQYAGGQVDPAASIQVTEQAAAGTSLTNIVATDGAAASTTNLAGRTATIFVNAFHSATVTFTNTPDATGCTFTKGWYRNNGSNTVIALADGLTKSQQQQVFNATPGQPGNVTWTGGNNTLNLYQQLLAAINNLGGDETAGPAALDAAIAAAKAGTTVTTNGGGVQITLVAGTDVSGLIATLSSFNEGSLTGWPHCAD
jgi:hypothetical protein